MCFPFLLLAVQLVSGIAGVEYLQPRMAANSGMVAIAFGSGNAVYFAKSTDQGDSFPDPVKVSEDGKLALGSHRGPRVAIVSGVVVISAIVGEKGGGADGDLISWRSADGGKTWSAGTWKLEGCPMDGGSIAIDQAGQAVSVWRRENEIYRTAVNGTEELLGTGKNPAVALGKQGSYAAWTDPAGVRFLGPGQKEAAILDPEGRYVQVLALPGGAVLAAWQSGGSVRVESLP